MLFAILAGGCTALIGFFSKAGERAGVRALPFTFVFTAVATLVSLALLVRGDSQWGDVRLWALGISMGACFVGGTVVMLLANRWGPPSIVWAIANLGLILPIGLSIIILHEPVRATDFWITLCFAGMVGAFQRGTTVANDVIVDKRWAFALAVGALFVLNGLLMFGFKLKDAWFAQANTNAYMVLLYGSAVVIAGVLHLLYYRHVQIRAAELRWGAVLGLTSVLGVLLLIWAAHLPAVIIFPVVQGIALLAGAALTAAVFRERINRYKVIGMLCGLCVLALAVLRLR
jgi:drug/metabolite transporter (DMT)-like permease